MLDSRLSERLKRSSEKWLDEGERIWYNTFMTTTKRKGQDMTHDETRDNTTTIEATIIEADNREELRTAATTWSACECEDCRDDEPDPAGVQLETDPVKVAEIHDEIVAKARQASDERNGYDDEPEDDGQPSEYDEWQDYMGGDEYYDHSENACW